jgi:hypothetical protein
MFTILKDTNREKTAAYSSLRGTYDQDNGKSSIVYPSGLAWAEAS